MTKARSKRIADSVASIIFNVALAFGAQAADGSRPAIEHTLAQYAAALKAQDVEAVSRIYTTDAIFMPPDAPPIEGREGVSAAYSELFKSVKLDLTFQVDEIREYDAAWAYVRTRSNGTAEPTSDKTLRLPARNKEVFLMHKESDGWRVSSYIFSPIK